MLRWARQDRKSYKRKGENVTKRKCGKLAVFFLLALSLLAGCGKKAEDPANGKGRYEETEIALPDVAGEFVQICREDEKVVLYQRQEKGDNVSLKRFVMDPQTKTFAEDTPAGMAQLTLPADAYTLKIRKADAVYYVYYDAQIDDENLQGFLYTCDDTGMAEVTPEGWAEKDPQYGFVDTPEDIAVTDHAVIALFYTKIERYDRQTLSLAESRPLEGERYEALIGMGDSYALIIDGDSGTMQGIGICPEDSIKVISQVDISSKKSGSCAADADAAGNLIVANADGLHRKAKDAGQFEDLLDGSYMSFGLSDSWCRGMTSDMSDGTNEVYYALFQNDQGQKLYQYAYNPELPLKPEKELTVYTLYDQATINQAATLFQKKHPDTMVSVHVACADTDDKEAETQRNRLMTSLAAGDGEDVIVLSGLDDNALAKKGVLMDLSDIVTPMEENGELLQAIVDGEKAADGKQQILPVRFALPLLLSKEKRASEMTDLAALAKAAEQTDGSLLGTFTGEDLVETFAPYFMPDIIKDKQLDTEKLRTVLQELQTIAAHCDMVEKYKKGERASNEWDLPSAMQAVLCQISGFNDAMFDLAIINLVKGDYTSFENAYIPTVEIGVNANTKQADLAKEFAAFVMSREVQDGDFYDGFPVNKESLHMQVSLDRSDYAAYTTIEGADGQEIGLDIEPIKAADADKLEALCDSLSKKTVKDAKVLEELKKSVPDYLLGRQSLDDTISKIQDGVKIYLAE